MLRRIQASFHSLVLRFLQLKPTSLELDVFPLMVEDGELYCIEIGGELRCFEET